MTSGYEYESEWTPDPHLAPLFEACLPAPRLNVWRVVQGVGLLVAALTAAVVEVGAWVWVLVQWEWWVGYSKGRK